MQANDEDTNNCGSIDAVMEATSLALSPTAQLFAIGGEDGAVDVF